MEAFVLSIPHWLTDAVLRVSVILLLVAFAAVVVRALAEKAPLIEDDEDEDDLRGNGFMTQAEFDRAYGAQQ